MKVPSKEKDRRGAKRSGNAHPNIGLVRKFRAWMDLGRAQGISTTAAIAIIGALTSTAPLGFFDLGNPNRLDLLDMIGFILISCFSHTVPNCYIELGDLPLDSKIPESSMKPIVSGVLKKNEVMWFVRLGLVASFILCFLFFMRLDVLIFLGLSALWVMWYGSGPGKRIPGSYDFSFSLAYGFYVLFAVYAVGAPTLYTWLFIGVVVTGGTAFAQWENGLKDVEADRATGVTSFAVLTGVKGDKRLTAGHPFFIYGALIKAGMLACCFWALFDMWAHGTMLDGPLIGALGLGGKVELYSPYAIFLLTFGIGSQVFLLSRFLKHRTRLGIRKTILLDVPLSAIVGFSVVLGLATSMTLLLVILFLIGGYFVGSALQYGTEFKFGRYDETWDERMRRERKELKAKSSDE
jgi:4-hydroxybenzoate polyprenyltransferase